jgi:hypothetical protein
MSLLILCKTGHVLEAFRPIPLAVLDQWHTRLFGSPAASTGTQVPQVYACTACFRDPAPEEYLAALQEALPR